MTGFDYILLAILGMSALVGVVRGLIRESLSLVVWVLAAWLAALFGADASMLLESYIASGVLRLWAGRVLIFVGVLFAGGALGVLVGYVVRNSIITGPDRVLGMLFGAARGILVAGLLVLALQLAGFESEPWWRRAKLIPYAAAVGEMLRDAAEENFGIDVRAPLPGRSI
jgi:membrane protein required for colicin V production